ncbi:hypothetical protein KP509_34G034400 [Ceratopteris richardii]|uniref:Uncharacterized protein n=1 Tax=Ceratopteris richardii TaxID=49495 RepID=A0A8T2QK53_CERRI|nr:hypothetical protein KP509_34G034400 [Ceratopteris richardii]
MHYLLQQLTHFWSLVQGCKDLLVLSLGTGKVTKSYDANISRNWGLISWVFNDFHAPIIEIVSECSNDVVDYNISSFFKASGNHFNYLRVQAYNIQSDIEALDNTVNTNMKKLREIGERLLDVPLSRMDIETGRPITLQGEMSNKDALIRADKDAWDTLTTLYQARNEARVSYL